MRLRTEEGLDFWCTPLNKYRYNLNDDDSTNVITISLDDELYVVGVWTDSNICKCKARNFVGKYKIPVKVILAKNQCGEIQYQDQYEYTYEFYMKWKIKSKRLQLEREMLNN